MVLITRRRAVTTLAAALAGAVAVPTYAQAAQAAQKHSGPTRPRPLRQAHAHNDYLHERPLHDALSHGFTSVEADVFLVDGELLVAHEPAELDPTRTLRSLYLDPLLARVKANHGRVYRGYHRPVQLLIDIKTNGVAAYLELDRQLRPYRRMLSSCTYGRVRLGAVTPVISGDRSARVPMEAQRVRYAFYDGRLEDLGSSAPAAFIPLISSNWTQSFSWLGTGPFPATEREKLHTTVSTAHRNGQRVRFWATPDVAGPARDAVWSELLAARVDHLNTDDLAGLERFLRARVQ
ncbi:phosphatidylinositol-specific phospholipase C/glycerophosphodiester phosphodiesterase family protein [Streptomyces sp. NBC_01142]|uniref:phosphatidylinositol-specific phospholipase C/glycerophosphodiester phosphodiesterase family protein n=1 Tax=Streptomyces sp. NBC_01142 TaxID=2975865 RepID=UPI0022583EEF|nr:phosphatidylinositol-specific phospholipase C/glycerophosphodiester phosphodiesterase family protein [Streptomyces sp. NBC_01142]MCX4820986.1 phosphatidylinositol-specific phospholipase C/glycerophosphodiester phosphodiesterase family protein [Streptomyces sp. NBC_01142]